MQFTTLSRLDNRVLEDVYFMAVYGDDHGLADACLLEIKARQSAGDSFWAYMD